MIKFQKKDIGLLCRVKWRDAISELSADPEAFWERGFAQNVSVGYLIRFSKDRVMIASEKSMFCNEKDLTLIPKSWIMEIAFIKERNAK